MKRSLAATLVVMFLLFSISSAFAGDTKIRMGILSVLDTLPLQVAVKDGLFSEKGLGVELIPFASALERDTAMLAGQLDGYFGDLIATCLLIKSGVQMRVGLVSYRTHPGQPMFGVVAGPEKSKFSRADLKGAVVGISRSTIIEYLLDKILEHQDMSDDYFERLEIKKIPVRLQMLLGGKLDLALLPEPLMSLVWSKGGNVVLTAEMLDLPLTVLSFDQSVFEDGKTYVAFLEAYTEALKRLKNNPENYRELMAETCRIPAPLIAGFPIYSYPAPALPSEAEVMDVQDWMIEKGMLVEKIPYEQMMAPATSPE